MKNKRRRVFKGYVKGCMVVHGVLYDQGNIQVLYRHDIGWTGEQYNSISHVFDLVPNLNTVKADAKINAFDKFLKLVYYIRRQLNE